MDVKTGFTESLLVCLRPVLVICVLIGTVNEGFTIPETVITK